METDIDAKMINIIEILYTLKNQFSAYLSSLIPANRCLERIEQMK